jgi:anti-sigma factor RsiW
MKNTQPTSDDRILQYLDGQLTMRDKEDFEVQLKSDSDLKERFFQLKLMHDTLGAGRLENPGKEFTANVMRNLARASQRLTVSPKNGLMLLLGVGIALTLGVIFLSSGGFDQLSGVISLEQVKFPKKIIQQPLPSIPFNAGLVMKILLGVNLAIAFVLFDRTVLQPIFRNRAVR